MPSATPSAVPDVLAPGLDVVFCGINPGFLGREGAHFANPRNDFWRLLHAAGFTPRLVDPNEQSTCSVSGTAPRTRRTGRKARPTWTAERVDFDGIAERLERLFR